MGSQVLLTLALVVAVAVAFVVDQGDFRVDDDVFIFRQADDDVRHLATTIFADKTFLRLVLPALL